MGRINRTSVSDDPKFQVGKSFDLFEPEIEEIVVIVVAFCGRSRREDGSCPMQL